MCVVLCCVSVSVCVCVWPTVSSGAGQLFWTVLPPGLRSKVKQEPFGFSKMVPGTEGQPQRSTWSPPGSEDIWSGCRPGLRGQVFGELPRGWVAGVSPRNAVVWVETCRWRVDRSFTAKITKKIQWIFTCFLFCLSFSCTLCRQPFLPSSETSLHILF